MKKSLSLILLLAFICISAMFAVSCKPAVADNAVPYELAKNYFISNTLENSEPLVAIGDEQTFNEYFGMATIMGKDGQPTPIDFNKDFVICISVPTTDVASTISVESLVQNPYSTLALNYRVTRGEKQSYSTHPFELLIVSKRYEMPVTLNEVSAAEKAQSADIQGKWRIENVVVNDSLYAMPSEETPGHYPFITFDADSTYFISTNCNSISGTYTQNGDSLRMNDGARTEMACDNMRIEDLLVKVLPQINSVDVQSDTVVRLNSASPACIILTRSKQPME